jgi:undecaprenyl-diphosphatase
MNTIIIFCAEYLIYVSALYAFARIVLTKKDKDYIKILIIVFGSAVIAWIIAHVLKDIIAHPRPNLANALIKPDSVYSFPSGHSTFMFTLAFVLYYFDKYAGKVIFTLAVLTGFSRVVGGVHYWYDILGGVVLAAVVAYVIVRLNKYFFGK